MIALKIAEVKDFMNKLLCQDVFDPVSYTHLTLPTTERV